jgi:hypothetical protein
MLICCERKTLLNGWLILADKFKRTWSVFIWMLHIFHTYVACVLFGCCVFQVCFSSVSEACFKCFNCPQTYVATIVFGCFKSRSGIVSLPILPSAASSIRNEGWAMGVGRGSCVRRTQARKLCMDGRCLRSGMDAGWRWLRTSRLGAQGANTW